MDGHASGEWWVRGGDRQHHLRHCQVPSAPDVLEAPQRVGPHHAVIESRVVVVAEEVVSRHHILHSRPVELGDQPQPHGQLVGSVVVLDSGLHAWT